MFKTRIACETPWKSNTLWPILRINSDTNCSQNWCLKILERTVTNQFIMYLRIHSISLNSPFFGEMNQLPPADIIPGWITIRNTIGQALVGIEPNKASRSTRLEDAWKPKLQLVHPKNWNVSWICMMSSGSCSDMFEAMFVCFDFWFFLGGRCPGCVKNNSTLKMPKRRGDKRIAAGKPSFDDPSCRRSLE